MTPLLAELVELLGLHQSEALQQEPLSQVPPGHAAPLPTAIPESEQSWLPVLHE